MQSLLQRLLDNFRSPSGVCVEKSIYKRIVLTRLVKVPLAIFGGLFLLSVLVVVYASISHRLKDPFPVQLRNYGFDFRCTKMDNKVVTVEYFDLNTKMTGSMQFGNTVVFGLDSSPIEFSESDSVFVQRLFGDQHQFYEWTKFSDPLVYLELSGNHVDKFLSCTNIRYGLIGSRASWFFKPNSPIEYVLFDKYKLKVREFQEKILLHPVTIQKQEERIITLGSSHKCYLIIDDLHLGRTAQNAIHAKDRGSTNGYWLIQNTAYESEF